MLDSIVPAPHDRDARRHAPWWHPVLKPFYADPTRIPSHVIWLGGPFWTEIQHGRATEDERRDPLVQAVARAFCGRVEVVAARNPFLSGESAWRYWPIFEDRFGAPALLDAVALQLRGFAAYAVFPWIGRGDADECALAGCRVSVEHRCDGEPSRPNCKRAKCRPVAHRCVGRGCAFGTLDLTPEQNALAVTAKAREWGLTVLLLGDHRGAHRIVLLIESPMARKELNALLRALACAAGVEVSGHVIQPASAPSEFGGMTPLPDLGFRADGGSEFLCEPDTGHRIMGREEILRRIEEANARRTPLAIALERLRLSPEASARASSSKKRRHKDSACAEGAKGEVYTQPQNYCTVPVILDEGTCTPGTGTHQDVRSSSKKQRTRHTSPSPLSRHAPSATISYEAASGETVTVANPLVADFWLSCIVGTVTGDLLEHFLIRAVAEKAVSLDVSCRSLAGSLGVSPSAIALGLDYLKMFALPWLSIEKAKKGTTVQVDLSALPGERGSPQPTSASTSPPANFLSEPYEYHTASAAELDPMNPGSPVAALTIPPSWEHVAVLELRERRVYARSTWRERPPIQRGAARTWCPESPPPPERAALEAYVDALPVGALLEIRVPEETKRAKTISFACYFRRETGGWRLLARKRVGAPHAPNERDAPPGACPLGR